MPSLLVFNRVYRLEIASHVGIFDPSCELLPLYLSLTSPTPLPLPKVNVQNIQIVWAVGGTTFRDWCLYSSFVHDW